MEQARPTESGQLTDAGLLAPFARRLLGVTVTRLWRLATVSDDATIALLDTLVLDTDAGFVSLLYTQQGLSCQGPMPRNEIRWDTEPDLPMGRTPDAEEWLDLELLEDQPIAPRLPLFVHALTGWFGVGPYTDTFALILTGQGDELVIKTTDSFDLECTTRQDARQRAELVAANMDMRMVDQELHL